MKPSKRRRSFSRPGGLLRVIASPWLAFAWRSRFAAPVGAATTEEEGFELVLRHKPSLLICSSTWKPATA